MKTFLILLFSFQLFGTCAQTDTILVVPEYYNMDGRDLIASCSQRIDNHDRLVCYYDSARTKKILEATKIGDNLWNYKQYYLHGMPRESYRYDTLIRSVEWLQYYPNGDPKMAEKRTLGKAGSDGYSLKIWGYTPERRLMRIHYSFMPEGCTADSCIASISFDQRTGDTASTYGMNGCFSVNYENGQRSSYRKTRKDTENYLCAYPVSEQRGLSLSFCSENDPHNRYYQAEDRAQAISRIDSLPFYRNLRFLYIGVQDETLLPYVIEKLNALPQLKYLHTVHLVGKFTEIPPGVLRCSQLKTLHLSNTNIRVVPKEIRQLTMLTTFAFNNYDPLHRYGETFHHLAQLPGLFNLSVSYPTDSLIPRQLRELKQLKTLSLAATAEFSGCPDIYRYPTAANQHVDSINMHLLFSISGLQELTLCENLFYSPVLRQYQPKKPTINVGFGYQCFIPETEITLANGGRKAISELLPGDEILGYDEVTGKTAPTIVNNVYRHEVNTPAVVEITLQFSSGKEQRIVATREHPFLAGNSWTKAGDLHTGQTLQFYNGAELETVAITRVEYTVSDVEAVYNLNTTLHTFFAAGVIVHNK